MKAAHLIIALLVAVSLAEVSPAEDKIPAPKDWLRDPPAALMKAKGIEVAETDYYEVGLTHVFTAVSWLGASSVKELKPDEAQFLTGHYYKAPAGKKIFLVRGLFANETGSHSLVLYGDSLVVSHVSLGHSSTPSFSPLIVHLDHAPTNLYVSISGAQ
jgi:hypothetical protein